MCRVASVLAVALLAALVATSSVAFPSLAEEKLVTKPSPHSVAETLDRFVAAAEGKGLTVFARIDHAAGAKKVGQDLAPTQVVLFGSPKLGTPLIRASRSIGIDLPLKVLAWQDGDGKVFIGYVAPEDLRSRHGVSGQDALFDKMTGALNGLTDAAVKP